MVPGSIVAAAIELCVLKQKLDRPIPPLALAIHNMFSSCHYLLSSVGSTISRYDFEKESVVGSIVWHPPPTCLDVQGGVMVVGSPRGVMTVDSGRGYTSAFPIDATLSTEEASAVCFVAEDLLAFATGKNLTLLRATETGERKKVEGTFGWITAISKRDSATFYLAHDYKEVLVLNFSLDVKSRITLPNACIKGLTRLPNRSVVASDSIGFCLWFWSEESDSTPRRLRLPSYPMCPHALVLRNSRTLIVSFPFAKCICDIEVPALYGPQDDDARIQHTRKTHDEPVALALLRR